MNNFIERSPCCEESKRCYNCKYFYTEALMYPSGKCALTEVRFFCGIGDICDKWEESDYSKQGGL